jgi:putative SOS response-associated peptidase YedK
VCGRFTLRASSRDLAQVFIVPDLPLFPPRYNIAPGQLIAAVRPAPGGRGRELVALRWRLVPRWASDPAVGHRLINARAETAAAKPSLRAAFEARRCLLPADGFYEWRKAGSRKQPYFIARRDGRPFGFAGLRERLEEDGEVIESAAILTTAANELMRPLHDRMPVILDPGDHARWLDPDDHDSEAVHALRVPYWGGRLDGGRGQYPGQQPPERQPPVRATPAMTGAYSSRSKRPLPWPGCHVTRQRGGSGVFRGFPPGLGENGPGVQRTTQGTGK